MYDRIYNNAQTTHTKTHTQKVSLLFNVNLSGYTEPRFFSYILFYKIYNLLIASIAIS